MQSSRFFLSTPDHWRLDVKRYFDIRRFNPQRHPILFLPGYGMNSELLSYHPSGASIIEYFAQRGYEVWAANLRGQGDTHKQKKTSSLYGFQQLAFTDLPLVFEHIQSHSQSNHTAPRIHLMGCSLGATLFFIYLAHHPNNPYAKSLTSIGGPLRWEKVHPLVQTVFRSPRLAGTVPIKGTRQIVRTAIPVLKRVPAVLSFYLNAQNIELEKISRFAKGIEDPSPYLNAQIAHWIKQQDLIVRDLNITQAMGSVTDLPLLCVLGNRDGVVPPASASSILDAIGSRDTQTIIAGNEHKWFAHADLFVSNDAQSEVFAPMAHWLEDRDA